MYAQYFGLKREPFSIAPDPRYLFMSERHREALAHLLYGLNAGGGFVLLTGEIGAGKTTVCRCFLEQIPERCNVGYVFNPKLTVRELLRSICDEFHVGVEHVGPGTPTIKGYVDPLNDFLLKAHGQGQNNILIIDEAQNLSADVLEQLRLLTNLETSERKLLQIILIGQPELREMLERPELEQLAQRVIARYHLEALSEAETTQYIRYRLGVSGLSKGHLFDKQAVQRIFRISRGVPRRINLLCDRALLGAYSEGKPHVDGGIVDKAATEVFGKRSGKSVSPARRPRYRGWLIGGAAAVAAAVLLALVGWFIDPALARRLLPGGRAAGLDAAVPQPAAAASAPIAAAASASAERAAAVSQIAAPAVDTHLTTAVGTLAPAAAARPAADLPAVLQALLPDEPTAWRQLAPLWQLTLDDSEPCASAQRQQIRCWRTNASLALIRQLARPGILTLHDEGNRSAYAVLTGLGAQHATLQLNGVSFAVPLTALAQWWRGDYATFWRAPPGYTSGAVSSRSGAAADWLSAKLQALAGTAAQPAGQTRDEQLRAQVAAFQLAQGLQPDGLAGPTTFMQLNRSAGIDEPRLQME